jgi:hypothetical protein
MSGDGVSIVRGMIVGIILGTLIWLAVLLLLIWMFA